MAVGRNLFSGKRAIFFSLSAFFLVSILIYAISMRTSYKMANQEEVIAARISSMDNFLTDVSADLERGLYISSSRALLSMADYITSRNTYLSSSGYTFREAMINGTIMNESRTVMQNSTFTLWAARIKARAATIGLLVDFDIKNVSIYHENPWYVTVNSTIQINLTDTAKTARWNITKDISTRIDVVGLEDPVYVMSTYGRVISIINMTPYENHYVQGYNITNLTRQCEMRYYTNSTGPSYLMRLEGNFSDSPFGIESLVYVEDLIDQDVPLNTGSSVVDYLYLGNRSTGKVCTINNTPSGWTTWFRIDQAHLQKYQAVGQNLSCS